MHRSESSEYLSEIVEAISHLRKLRSRPCMLLRILIGWWGLASKMAMIWRHHRVHLETCGRWYRWLNQNPYIQQCHSCHCRCHWCWSAVESLLWLWDTGAPSLLRSYGWWMDRNCIGREQRLHMIYPSALQVLCISMIRRSNDSSWHRQCRVPSSPDCYGVGRYGDTWE